MSEQTASDLKARPASSYEQIAEVDPATAARQLVGLRDIATVEPVSWRPATAGWYVLFVLIVLAVARIAWILRRRRRARAYRRTALADLAALESQIADPRARDHLVAAVNALVKRVRLSDGPRPAVASLSGAAWLEDLDATWKGGFASGAGRLLADRPYQAAGGVTEADARALVTLVREWIRGHRA